MYKILKNKRIIFIFGLTLLIILNSVLIPSILPSLSKNNTELKEIKSSGVYNDIDINDLPSSLNNWTWAETQPWFGGGAGTSGDPYIIEDHTFEYSAGSGACFSMINSRKYFIINNCTFRNSALGNVGLLLVNVTNGQILNCYIYYNVVDGMSVGYTSEILISNNEIHDNGLSGIYMWGTSENNTITGNIFHNNAWYGVEIYSSNSLIYNNFFTNPIIDHAYDVGTNDWNNTVIGNYWDDYVGYDMDLDGIGDTPYDVPPGGGSQDYLPIWDIQGPITIDDLPSSMNDWTWAVSQAWCTGTGTSGDPYVIDYLKIRDVSTNCISIQNSNAYFVIDHCELNNSVSGSGVYLSNVTNGRLTNNYLFENYNYGIHLSNNCDFNIISQNYAIKNRVQGIRLDISDNNTITGNTMNNNGGTSNFHGLGVYNSDGNLISHNTANGNYAHGIRINNGEFNSLTENTVENNGDRGISIDSNSHHNTLLENTVFNNTNYGIYIETSNYNSISENIASNNPSSNYYLLNSANNTLYGNIADEISDYGILLENSDFNDILECETYNSGTCGIHLYDSHNNTIIDCVANYNFRGIYAYDSSENIISGNIVNNNTQWGLGVYLSYNNSLIDNFAQYNIGLYGGIMVAESDYTLVENNQVLDNNLAGIYFWGHGDDSIVRGNVIRDNINGIYLEPNSDDNLFYENFFIGNDYHVEGLGINNDWNNTIIGNYWDNYTGPDLDHNGIGDIPHDITLSPLRQDFLPIVDDQPPTVTINSPSDGDVFGTTPPNYDVTITDDYLLEMWYTMDGGLHNYTFTGLTGDINQSVWDAIADGSITLTFYASDKSGNVGSDNVNIEKDTQGPTIIITSPTTGATFGASAPSFIVEITDEHLDVMWYSLDGGLTNFTFTANGTIDQTAWAALLEGSVTITFYANDTLGNIVSESVNVEKAIQPQGDNFITIIIVISIISGAAVVTVVIILVLRKRKAGEEV